MTWIPDPLFGGRWDSALGDFRIVYRSHTPLGSGKPYRLTSFVHEPPAGQPVCCWDFRTLREAQEHAETL